jgi:twitching motility protein PilT
MARIDTFLKLVVVQDGSDLHLISGSPPRIRIHGEMETVKYRQLTQDETTDLLLDVMPAGARKIFDEDGQTDFAYEVPDLARFRVNVFQHAHGVGGVLRVVPHKILSLEDLDLPPVLQTFCRLRSGFVLVTGPTGSGKSTTLGAMVDHINRSRGAHIITIENPIEFVHSARKSLISQREVGSHCPTFTAGLRSALREDPDVIVLGEMRDLETIRGAVTAAEMGALVFSTLHTVGAVATVERIVNVFPSEEQAFIRSMLSTSLSGVISQRLVRRGDGKGRVAVIETLVNTPAAGNLIREGRMDQLTSVIQAGALQGMQTFDNALRKMVDAQVITLEQALRHATDQRMFSMRRPRDSSGRMRTLDLKSKRSSRAIDTSGRGSATESSARLPTVEASRPSRTIEANTKVPIPSEGGD